MHAHDPTRWVRIHYLPRSRRLISTASDRTEVLRRHNAVLATLASTVAKEPGHEAPDATAVFIMTCEYGPHDLSPTPPRLVPHRTHWLDFFADGAPLDEDDAPIRAMLSIVDDGPGSLDPLLEATADGIIARVLIIDGLARWAYHPYDGGGDAFVRDRSTRDELAHLFSDWLSPRPDGL